MESPGTTHGANVAPNNMAAIGAITTLKELDRRVPEDVAVVSCMCLVS
jgi:DNA-binding LacI/PurR family transcriptional regulator